MAAPLGDPCRRARPVRKDVIGGGDTLHPQWQRRLLPSLLAALGALGDVSVQLVVSTHAPLMLASVETEFDDTRDALFHFDMGADGPKIERVVFAKRGDVVRWLVSPIFGLEQARSVDAERVIEAAERFMLGRASENIDGLKTRDEIHERLQAVLGGSDPFWPRWIVKTGSA